MFGCFSEGNNRIGVGGAPGLCHVTRVAGAVDLQHVSAAGDWGAHGQEVGPRPADGELGQVGQRLADSCSEQEGAHHLVEGRQVLVEVGVGVETLGVHQVGFARGDLWTKWMENKDFSQFTEHQCCRCGRRPHTHDDDGAGDGDGGHAAVGDGVSLVRVADAGVIAVDAPLVRTEHQRQDGRRQSRCGNRSSGESARYYSSVHLSIAA